MSLIQGMNYGSDFVTGSPYNLTQVANDCNILKGNGVTHLRCTFPAFFGNMTGDSGYFSIRDMVATCKAQGMTVLWGGTIAYNPFTLTNFNNYSTFLQTVQAPWAAANGIDEFAIGNELELTVDGTTMTVAALQTALRSLASTIAGIFPRPVTYNADGGSTTVGQWQSGGLGGLSSIGFNCYFGTALSVFEAGMTNIITAFPGGNAYTSEWATFPGIDSAYPPTYPRFAPTDAGIGNTQRLAYLQSISSILPRAYYFTYRSNPALGDSNLFSLYDGDTGALRWAVAQPLGLGSIAC